MKRIRQKMVFISGDSIATERNGYKIRRKGAAEPEPALSPLSEKILQLTQENAGLTYTQLAQQLKDRYGIITSYDVLKTTVSRMRKKRPNVDFVKKTEKPKEVEPKKEEPAQNKNHTLEKHIVSILRSYGYSNLETLAQQLKDDYGIDIDKSTLTSAIKGILVRIHLSKKITE